MNQDLIAKAIAKLLTMSPPEVVHIAGAINAPPPPLTYVVNFPRLDIPLRGRYENEIELAGHISRVTAKPGDVLLLPPNCWNRPTWRHPVQLLSILFGARQMGLSLVTTKGDGLKKATILKFPIPPPSCGPARSILDTLLELTKKGSPPSTHPDLVRAILRCLYEVVSQPLPKVTRRRADRLLEQLCVHLQEHYQYETTRESVARLFGIAPNHLSRLFRTHGNMSFNQYLNYVRIDRAKLLLKTYPMKMDDIAQQCGFRDTPYFCRTFRRITRQTPGEYRQIHAK